MLIIPLVFEKFTSWQDMLTSLNQLFTTTSVHSFLGPISYLDVSSTLTSSLVGFWLSRQYSLQCIS